MKYFKQLYFELRHQPMMTWVTVAGTALAVFMVMSMFISNNASNAEVAPDVNRSRMVSGENLEIKSPSIDGSSALSDQLARRIYGDLKGVDLWTYVSAWDSPIPVGKKLDDTVDIQPLHVDGNFWKIYKYKFLCGSPFTESDSETKAKVCVLSRSAARNILGTEDAVGMQVSVRGVPYTVKGVTADISPLLVPLWADIYIPYGNHLAKDNLMSDEEFIGRTRVLMLMSPGTKIEDLQAQVERKYKVLNAEYKKRDTEIFYHGQPYDMPTVSEGNYGSNTTPETDNKSNYIIYAILLILPAINLASMTNSRLRRRVSEIGVRRAFGASRLNILWQMVGENFLLTLLGGIIGLALCLLFVMTVSQFFFTYTGGMGEKTMDVMNARPTFEMLFTWSTFFISLGCCLILNLLSVSLPAWRASRVAPAVAISKAK